MQGRGAMEAHPAALVCAKFLMKNPALSRVLPFLIYLLFLGVADLLVYLQSGGGQVATWDLRWLYPVKTVAVALVLLWFWKSYQELSLPFQIPFLHWLAAVLTGTFVFVLWINLDQGWLTLGSASGFNPGAEGGGMDWSLVFMRLLGAILVVPLMEELFWRSFFMRWLDRMDFLSLEPILVSLRSVMITSVAFGFEHHLWLAGIMAGLAYGWLYKRFNNLWIPVAAHATTNGLLGIWVLSTGNWQFW